jgi:hypothetical protein
MKTSQQLARMLQEETFKLDRASEILRAAVKFDETVPEFRELRDRIDEFETARSRIFTVLSFMKDEWFGGNKRP